MKRTRLPTFPMMQALELAKKATQVAEVPVGAVLVLTQTGEIIGQGHNLTRTNHDPTAHAEIVAIRQALLARGQERFWEDVDLYVTLEPCPMCAQAISFARLKRVYFGAYDPKGGGVDHGARIYEQSSCHHRPEVYGGIEEAACQGLLVDFFKGCRGEEEFL